MLSASDRDNLLGGHLEQESSQALVRFAWKCKLRCSFRSVLCCWKSWQGNLVPSRAISFGGRVTRYLTIGHNQPVGKPARELNAVRSAAWRSCSPMKSPYDENEGNGHGCKMAFIFLLRKTLPEREIMRWWGRLVDHLIPLDPFLGFVADDGDLGGELRHGRQGAAARGQ